MEENVLMEEVTTPKYKRGKNQNSSKSMFNQKKCEVISYDSKLNVLDLKFDKYGIRIKNVENFTGNDAIVQYKGEIGTSNFEYQLLR